MKPPFIVARPHKLHWMDQVVFLPLGLAFCIFFPLSALLGHGEHWLWGRVPLATWVLIGLAFLLLAIIERLALIIVELKTLTFVCTNLLKDADDPDGLINQFALSRMRQTIRRALGAPDEET